MQPQSGMPPLSPTAGGARTTTVGQPSPISSRAPEPGSGGSAPPAGGRGSFEHEGADEGDRSGSAGNRWPRQETLALLKIRSEMDAAFREAALKGPLWEEVSRKLAAMGYNRSAKKCREKFENVDKYYKRTKDGRAGRGDGKTYRFFSELEALHGASSSPHPSPPTSLVPTPVAMAPPAAAAFPPSMAPATMHHAEPPPPPPVVTMPPPVVTTTAPPAGATRRMTAGDVMSFSSSSDGEDTDETSNGAGKRKRRDGDGGSSSKMMRFFEGLMRQVMERQEKMQQRFIEAIERREQDRMIREEAWRRQEVARLAREQDALAQERAMASSRDAAVVSFIQRITGQTIPTMPPSSFPAPPPTTMNNSLKPTPVALATPPPHQHQPPPSVQLQPAPTKPHTSTQLSQQLHKPQQPSESKDAIVVRAPVEDTMGSGGAPSPSRWPKAEVHALIQLRAELEARYQDSVPKGPLWEDISAGMRRMGYNRSAKRCKEKWENINKYFKKVKESNKKRPEDSKTCPYYHQLDALYRSKALQLASSTTAGGAAPAVTVLAAVPLSQTPPHHLQVTTSGGGGGNKQDCSNGNGNGCATSRTCSSADKGGSNMQTQGTNGTATNKEDNIMMKEKPTMAEETPQPVSMNDSYVNDRMDAGDDSDSMDDDDEDDFDDEEDDVGAGNNGNTKMQQQYEIQFQRQTQSSVVRPNASGGAGSGPGPTTTTGSFLTMVHH